MFQKNCYTCNRPSFSSVEVGNWLCPTCGQDLTNQKVFNPEWMSHFTRKMHKPVTNSKFVLYTNSARYDVRVG